MDRKRNFLPRYEQTLSPDSGGPAPNYPRSKITGVHPDGTRAEYWNPILPVHPHYDLEALIQAAIPKEKPTVKLTFEIDFDAEEEFVHDEDRMDDVSQIREFIRDELAWEIKNGKRKDMRLTLPGGATFYIKPNVEVTE